jgi:hypothetical protein
MNHPPVAENKPIDSRAREHRVDLEKVILAAVDMAVRDLLEDARIPQVALRCLSIGQPFAKVSGELSSEPPTIVKISVGPD